MVNKDLNTMANNYFKFKQFIIYQEKCGMKVNTDSVLLACYTDVSKAHNILDLGTGTGLIAIQLAQRTTAHIIAIDLDQDAIKQANENVIINQKQEQIEVLLQDFNSYEPTLTFDLIISNPPYFDEGSPTRSLNRQTARYTTTLTHEVLFNKAYQLLTDLGVFAVCLPYEKAELVKKTFAHLSWKLISNIYVEPKIGKPCYLELLFWQKDVNHQINSKTKIETITIRSTDNNYTPQYKEKTKDLYLKF